MFALLAAVVWLVNDILSGQADRHLVIPFWNSLVRLGFFLIFALMLARLREATERERQLSRVDPLTAVSNSRAFLEAARGEIVRARRFAHSVSLAYLDCDNFKQVNDNCGHATGDELLRVVARTLVGCCRQTDMVARLGGDEFAVLLPETPGG